MSKFRTLLLNSEFDRLGNKGVLAYFEILSHFPAGIVKNKENYARISDVQAELPNAVLTNIGLRCYFWNQLIGGSIIESFPRYCESWTDSLSLFIITISMLE